jgi:flagellum-specific peptidoglycan hydrolase FlgJ
MQSYNRYSYVENGPLSAVDPTGNIVQGELTTDPLQFEGQFGPSAGIELWMGTDQGPLQLDQPAQGMTTAGQSGAGPAVTSGNSTGIASNPSSLPNAADKPVESGGSQSAGLQTGLSVLVTYYVAGEVEQGFGDDDQAVGDEVKSASGSDQSGTNGPVETVTVTHRRHTDGGYQNANFSGCDLTCKQAFVNAHLADASIVARQLHVTPQEILGLSALESQWGTSRFAVGGNNYFGLHSGKYANQTGSMSCLGSSSCSMATFGSYLDSAEAFAATKGALITNISDATTFAQTLQSRGGFGINTTTGQPVPNYVPNTAATINGLGVLISRMSL